MKYFAYGSNLLIERLKERVPSTTVYAVGVLDKHKLMFHKKGVDGSSKCDVYQTNNESDFVIGVIFDIDEAEKHNLDCAEGLGYGYDEKRVSVSVLESKETVKAITYYATNIVSNMKPYDWYKDFVLYGAKQNNFPEDYITMIENVECMTDSNSQRTDLNRQIVTNANV